MKAVILAAGFGKRLRPLTEYLPKVLIPILGIPAMDHVLNHLFQYDIQDVGVNIHYRSDQIISFLHSDHRKYGNIQISEEYQQGQAHDNTREQKREHHQGAKNPLAGELYPGDKKSPGCTENRGNCHGTEPNQDGVPESGQ